MTKDSNEKKLSFKNILSNTKEWFSGMGKGWKIPAAVGVVAGIAISGPVGLGVAGGMWASSKVKGAGGATDQAKNAALMAVGAGTCAVSTSIGATIGSFFFPIVGTLIGAAVGAVFGMMVSRHVTKKVRAHYKMDSYSSAPASAKPKTKEKPNHKPSVGKGQDMQVAPDRGQSANVKKNKGPNLS